MAKSSNYANFRTADLCDCFGDSLQVAEDVFGNFGGLTRFHGRISTVKAFEDNSLVRIATAESGDGRVLVVDSAGSMRRSMLGDMLAQQAADNGWHGVVINGCLRDCAVIAGIHIGVKALGVVPRKTEKQNQGLRDVPVHFAGVTFTPGDWLYADEDGIVVSPTPVDDNSAKTDSS